jgi:4-amino-4-deoxy-L-arabinose transferase-like glycosyltransferase
LASLSKPWRLGGVAANSLALGIALRALWVLAGPRVVLWDAVTYRELAVSLAEGHGYRTAEGPTAFWVPGWPAWMSVFARVGLGDTAVALGSVALGAATVALTHQLAGELYGKRAAAAAAVMVALLPSLVTLPGLLVSENLALPLTLGTVLLLVRAVRNGEAATWALAGITCGVAVLVREASLALALAGVALGWGRPRARAAKRMAAFVLSAALVVSPWVLRNRAVVGVTTLTTSSALNLCAGLGEEATGGYRFLPWAGEEREAYARALECVREGLARRPWSVVTLIPAKVLRWVAYDDWQLDVFYSRALTTVAWRGLAVVCDVAYWAMLAGAVVAVGKRRGDRTLMVVVAGFIGGSLVTFGNERFHVAVLPILAVLASALVGGRSEVN